MNNRHLKIALLVLLFFISLSLFAGVNRQYIVPVDESDNLMDIMKSLYIESGLALPSSTAPYSVAELQLMTEQVKVEKLNSISLKQYSYLLEKLQSYTKEIDNDVLMDTNSKISLESYAHLNTDYFTERSDWVYDWQEQQKLFNMDVDLMANDIAYSFVNIQLGVSEHSYYEDGGIDFGTGHLSFNIPGVDNISLMDINTDLSDRAFLAFGGDNWSVQAGRDQISWGNGISGNLFLSDNLEYQNMARYTFFGKKIKYSYIASFFPFQGNYVSDLEVDSVTSQYDELVGFSMFTAHKIEGRLFNRLGWSLSEGNMFVSKDGTVDMSAFNPMLSYHSLYYKANCNSIISADLDLTIGSHFNLYAQAVIDDLVFPIGESKTGSWSPDAWGVLGGFRITTEKEGYQNLTTFEFAYTTPYLYMRNTGDTNSEQEGYGINFIVALRKFDQNGIYFDEQYLGYEYGGDAIVFNINNKIYDRNKWSFETNLFLMLHGTFDTDTTWAPVGEATNRTEDSTPTTYNYSDDGKNAVEYTGILGFYSSFNIADKFEVYNQLDFVGIINPDNVYDSDSSNFEADVQLTVGMSISY
ncbi:MAG: capsule assembly Wzi family protein [Sphaerochaetaceae bacterium]|nr:capsule assembly Wzi family protein [Sphaerochaetaceae bacterium]